MTRVVVETVSVWTIRNIAKFRLADDDVSSMLALRFGLGCHLDGRCGHENILGVNRVISHHWNTCENAPRLCHDLQEAYGQSRWSVYAQ